MSASLLSMRVIIWTRPDSEVSKPPLHGMQAIVCDVQVCYRQNLREMWPLPCFQHGIFLILVCERQDRYCTVAPAQKKFNLFLHLVKHGLLSHPLVIIVVALHQGKLPGRF